MCRALGRMMKENGASTTSTARDLGMLGSHSGNRSDEGSIQSSGPEFTGSTEAEGQPATGNNGGGNDNWNDAAWRSSTWQSSWYQGSYWHGGWQGSWWTPSWSGYSWDRRDSTTASLEEQEEEDAVIQVLPDAVQGWLLLDKCGLDPMERSVIQGDIKSNFTLAGVENSLHSHWTDEQLRRRDGEARNQTFFQEEDDSISEPDYEPEDAFFQGWSDQEVAWYQDAREQEQQAWIQLQQARRTLKDARARQSEVKMSRRFYRPGNGKGNAKSRGPVGAAPQPGPCLRCRRAHRTADCPSKGNSSEEKTLEAEHLAEFTFYQQGDNAEDIAATTPLANTHQESPDEQHDFYNEVFVVEGGQHVTTEMAIQQGKAILDPGATRSMGSLHGIAPRGGGVAQCEHGTTGRQRHPTCLLG